MALRMGLNIKIIIYNKYLLEVSIRLKAAIFGALPSGDNYVLYSNNRYIKI